MWTVTITQDQPRDGRTHLVVSFAFAVVVRVLGRVDPDRGACCLPVSLCVPEAINSQLLPLRLQAHDTLGAFTHCGEMAGRVHVSERDGGLVFG